MEAGADVDRRNLLSVEFAGKVSLTQPFCVITQINLFRNGRGSFTVSLRYEKLHIHNCVAFFTSYLLAGGID